MSLNYAVKYAETYHETIDVLSRGTVEPSKGATIAFPNVRGSTFDAKVD